MILATPALVAVAPAMNQGMWSHPATSDNMALLKQRQVMIFGPDSGEQACGDVGEGRMQQPDTIVDQVANCFDSGELAGKKVVITAGPTREAIDPVRYISNHSSGKMGYALSLPRQLMPEPRSPFVSGPVALAAPDRCTLVPVVDAAAMHNSATSACADADIFIAAAAVADYRLFLSPTKR